MMPDLSISERIELIRKVPIFSQTAGGILESLASAFTEEGFRTGALIFRKGDRGDAMFVIVSGKVRIHDGHHVMARMERGEVFGEYALIDDNVRSASVTAEAETRLLKLERDDFYRFAAGNIEVLRGVLLVLIGRMRSMNELEEKLSKSYLKIRKQKEQIEKQSGNISFQKEQLSQQNYDLTRLNEEKNHLISLVIHQIKNPLTSSLCMIEMMQAEPDKLSESQAQGLEVTRNSLRRINSLLNEFLDVNAIDSKVFKLKLEPLNLSEILGELIDNYHYFIGQKNLSLVQDIGQVNAKTNRVYFTQIADNMLSNAVKFTRPGGVVEVVLKDAGDVIRLSVKDDGPGLDKKKLEDLFNQYKRQGEMHLQHLPPTGLGLAIVHRYTSALNGDVWCECEPGKGTKFVVELKK
jgi:signal transduction histidine kinase